MTSRCCGCGEFSTPSPRDSRRRRLETSGSSSTAQLVRDADVVTVLDRGHRRRPSKPWIDNDLLEGYTSVETIHEEWSSRNEISPVGGLTSRSASIDRALRNMQLVRRAMEEGIEEMRCQIDQINFCNSRFKQKRSKHRYLDTITPANFEQEPKQSECIASARDTFYESSRSGTEHGIDDSGSFRRNTGCVSDETEFVSPVPTPNPSEIQETWMQRPSINNGKNNDDEDGPISPSVMRPIGDRSTSIMESLQDMECTPSPRMHHYPSKGFKTDVVLNLHSHCETPRKKEQSKRGSGLNKLVDMLSRARRGRRHTQSLPYTQSASPRLQSNRKVKTQRRWPRRIAGTHRTDTSSLACKFTDKYPIDACRWGRMGCFSPLYKGSQVTLDAEGTVAASGGEETSFVLCADEVINGVTCFDLDCELLNDWCFLGVISKKEAMRHRGPISESETAYGWSNRCHYFKNGLSAPSNGRPFATGTSLQIIVNADAGTLRCCFPSDRKSDASRSEPAENEMISLPKNISWTLAIEWKGMGRFELSGVRVWQ